jgi:hypothetical protein
MTMGGMRRILENPARKLYIKILAISKKVSEKQNSKTTTRTSHG